MERPYTAHCLRAEQRDYWSASRALADVEVEREDLTLVAVVPSVVRDLHLHLYSPAWRRGGLLFGHQKGETLHIILATTLGRSTWYDESSRVVLGVDDRFALGWSEALQAVLGSSVDWIGNWFMYSDGRMHSERKDQRYFRSGQRLGLFDERHTLLVVGCEDSHLACRAYRRDVSGQGQTEALQVSFEGIDLVKQIRLHLNAPV